MSTRAKAARLVRENDEYIEVEKYSLQLDCEEWDISDRREGVELVLEIVLEKCGYGMVYSCSPEELDDGSLRVSVEVIDHPDYAPQTRIEDYLDDELPWDGHTHVGASVFG